MIEQKLDVSLNKEQINAINTISGNLLILASAGTGKTTTVVERYINLVENHNMNPDEIMMTTFTNKAAKDMIRKIEKRTSKIPSHIGTMHSLFLRIIRENAEELSFSPNFTLLTEENDKKKIIKQILIEKNIEPTNNNILYLLKRIEKFKNAGINPDDLDDNIDVESGELIEEEIQGGDFIQVSSDIKKISNFVYKKYQEKLRWLNKLDFDDILLHTYLLLNKNENLRKQYKEKLKIIMVDEAQDLNVVQRNILELLQNDNLCLIGDDCQNIYSWRGASNELIFNFDKSHKKVVLKDNYRSSKRITDNINKIIDSIAFKINKKLNCTRDMGDYIQIRDFHEFSEEISFIASEVKKLLSRQEPIGEIAVLFRTNRIGKQIEREFIKNKIPCYLSRSVGFFGREEIKDILSFIRLKLNHNSVIDFERLLGLVEGVGKSKIEKLKEIANRDKIDIFNSLNFLNGLNVNLQTKTRLLGLRNILNNETENPIKLFTNFFNYWKRIEEKYSSESEKIEDKNENIKILGDLLNDYSFDSHGIRDFLDSLIEMEMKENDKNKVVLSTIHSAKGLEWKHVYLAGCNETIIPSYRGKLSKIKKDDELRLFYVAVSRAKDFLTITHSIDHGYRDFEPSQFLEIIDWAEENGGTYKLEKADGLVKANKTGSYHERIQRIKKKHPRAYEKWANNEKEIVRRLFLNGLKNNVLPTEMIKSLSGIFKRQPNAIRSYLRKLGVVKS